MRKIDEFWNQFINDNNILNKKSYQINASMIKKYNKEPRLMCYFSKINDLPEIFIKNNFRLLPIENGKYLLFKIEKSDIFINMPKIKNVNCINGKSIHILTKLGNSESQYMDYLFSIGLFNKLFNDNFFLVLRGRKRSPEFNFCFENIKIKSSGVQYEVDMGLEGNNNILLIEAKKKNDNMVNLRQIYYPYRSVLKFLKSEKIYKKVINIVVSEVDKYTYDIVEIIFKDINVINSAITKRVDTIKLEV